MSHQSGGDEPLSTGNEAGTPDDDAETRPAFIAGLYVPTVVDEDGAPIQASEIGTSLSDPDAAVMLPSDATGGGLYDGDYQLDVNGVFAWHSNLPSDAFGEVKVEAPGFGWLEALREPTGSMDVTLHKGYDVDRDVPASNYFREADLELEVSFEDSPRLRAYAGDELSARLPYVTPNKSALHFEKMISVASEVYGSGVEVADKVTRVDLGRLRKSARFLAYAQVAHIDMVTEDDLLRDAAIEGMTAFEEPIREATQLSEALNREISTTLAGPTVIYHDPSERPPEAAFRYTPEDPEAGQTVTFDAGPSNDPDGTIERYEWEVRRGSELLETGEGQEFKTAFPTEGNYPVTLTVVDSDGRERTEGRTVNVSASQTDLARFDQNDSGQIEVNDLQRAVVAHNSDEEIGGEEVTTEELQELIVRYNNGGTI
jgi:hypothetical protein